MIKAWFTILTLGSAPFYAGAVGCGDDSHPGEEIYTPSGDEATGADAGIEISSIPASASASASIL